MSPCFPTRLHAQAGAILGLHPRLHAGARPAAGRSRFAMILPVTPPSVHQMVLTLERSGLIRRQPGIARSIKVLVDPEALPPLRASSDQPVKSSVQSY